MLSLFLLESRLLPITKRIFVSNRLPFNVNQKTGEISRGSGGLVSALLGVNLDKPFVWMGFETNAKQAQILKARGSEVNPCLECCPVILPKETYDKYYDGFSNDLIWPLFHYEGHLASFSRDLWRSYLEANRKMALEIAKIAKPDDTVWIHDFHFMMLPQFLRELVPQIKIGFFLHIPFPSAEIFRQLPVRQELLKSLVQCDLIGFHEHSYLRHFIVSLKAVLGIDSSFFKAEIGEHTLHLGVYPISVDTEGLMQKARSAPVVERCQDYLSRRQVPFLILGVDRLDYTKGLELKLKGFQEALRKYPELIGQISLLQVAVPTRQKVPYYIKIKKEIDQLVGQINGEFARPEYVPVHYIFNSVAETDLLALYRRAECALITSKRDGMNLVGIEYAICQDIERPGVLILSEFAGAASLLSEALVINPWDAENIADALFAAYKMSLEEKRKRMEGLQAVLSRYSATKWAKGFLKDLDLANRQRLSKTLSLSPQRTAWPDRLSENLSSHKKWRLILDYDGTTVSLMNRPENAILTESTKNLLRKLNAKVDIFILSGRSREFLQSQFGDLPVFLGAEHGAYYRKPDGKWQSRISSDVQSWYSEVERVMEAYCERVPFSFIEKKEAALVWHYRESPAVFADFQAKKLDDELQVGLANEAVAVVMGSKIVEAKSVECNKGNFLRWLLQMPSVDQAFNICLGDDRTDEDMFRALGFAGCSIKVGEGQTSAHYRLANQAQVIPFFEELYALADQLDRRHSVESGRKERETDALSLREANSFSKSSLSFAKSYMGQSIS